MNKEGVLRISLRLLIFGWVFVLSSSMAAQQKPTKSKLDCDQLLIETAHILGGIRNRVPRWTNTVRIAIIGDVYESTHLFLLSLIAKISLFTGIEIQLLNDEAVSTSHYLDAVAKSPNYDMSLCSRHNSEECANFVIVFSTLTEMHKIAQKFPLRNVFQDATHQSADLLCFFAPGSAHNLEINRSIVFINSTITEPMKEACLQEEIVQSFGLFNDYSDSRYYSFNNVSSPKKLKVYDYILLASLYDRSFAAGVLTKSVVEQVANYCAKDNWIMGD